MNTTMGTQTVLSDPIDKAAKVPAFLRLSRELRDQIYDSISCDRQLRIESLNTAVLLDAPECSLGLACGQIHEEYMERVPSTLIINLVDLNGSLRALGLRDGSNMKSDLCKHVRKVKIYASWTLVVDSKERFCRNWAIRSGEKDFDMRRLYGEDSASKGSL